MAIKELCSSLVLMRKRMAYMTPWLPSFCFLVAALAVARVLYEAIFPGWLWLGRPFLGLLLVLLPTALGGVLWQRWSMAPPIWTVAPLLLPLLFLFNPVVNPLFSGFVLGVAFWLTAVLITHTLAPVNVWSWLGPLFIVIALLPIYLLTMPHTVGQADTFEFQVVAPQLGIVHPTGYPLYLLLGKLFTLIPISSVAWRLNLASAVYGIGAMVFLYAIGRQQRYHPLAALITAVIVGLTPTFWSQAIEAEVYTLHALVVMGVLWLIGRLLTDNAWHWQQNLALLLGLGLTNHLTTLFLLPGAALGYGWASPKETKTHFSIGRLGRLALLLALPLLLYLYLPWRWLVVNGEPMGLARFVDWVVGGRFQGALQWGAWLHDMTRYEVMQRLILNEWVGLDFLIILLGIVYYLRQRQWRFFLVCLITTMGYAFYGVKLLRA